MSADEKPGAGVGAWAEGKWTVTDERGLGRSQPPSSNAASNIAVERFTLATLMHSNELRDLGPKRFLMC